MANSNLYKELEDLREEEQDKTYYTYLEGPFGAEYLGLGTKEQCEKLKAEKEAEWQPGYLWQVNIYDHRIKENEYSYWD